MLRWWRVLNEIVFDGELIEPEIELREYKDVYAYTIPVEAYGLTRLSIVPRFASRKLFLSVLVHEMVHMWENQHFNRLGHGKRFNQWKSRIWWAMRLRLQVKV